MEPVAKQSFARGFIRRLLLVGVCILLLRLFYVVALRGGSCASGDFCLFSGSADGLSLSGSIARGAAYIRIPDGSTVSPELRRLWTSKEWRRAVEFYSSLFQDLIVEDILSPTSKSLCVDAASGHEVLALKEIGVGDAVGISKKKIPQLVLSGNILHQPFSNNTFDFIFSDNILDHTPQPVGLVKEMVRVLKPKGFLVLITASAGDLYSLHSLELLFDCCKKVRSREIQNSDSLKLMLEIVFQKEVAIQKVYQKGEEIDNVYPSTGGNLVSVCPIPEHKQQLLRFAEPLIDEEPLKPWITLKKNIKNIKYLPSMVEVSFKQRYVYIDVGARSYGSSIGSWFKKLYPKQNKTFEIYAIEADETFHEEYKSKKGINLLPFAAWIRNESISFEVDHVHDHISDEKGSGMGRIRVASASSNDLSSENIHMIQGFDFAEWLKSTVTAKDFVVVKMDVEGTEFDLIPRLFETGAICLIDELFLECHYNRWQRCCPGKRSPKYSNTYGQCMHLFSSLRESGVLVHQWW